MIKLKPGEEDLASPEIEEMAKNVEMELLPIKSRKHYEKQYEDFCGWCVKKNVQKYTESVLLVYFSEQSKLLKASSLWSKYSMLKATLIVKNNIDISKFLKLRSFLKRQNDGYKPKKSRILTVEQVDKFLLEAPDDKFLLLKVTLILGIAGACRGDELLNLSVSDIQDLDSSICVTVKNTKTRIDRTFIVKNSDRNPIGFVEQCKKYMSLRKDKTKHSRFFVQYKNNECGVQPVGKNSFGKMPETIASFLNLPEPKSYTGHCFRRTSASLLADAGADIDVLKRHGGWKSSTVAEGYVETSVTNKKNIADLIFGYDEPRPSILKTDSQARATEHSLENVNILHQVENDSNVLNRLFNIVNCSNVNINVNFVQK